MSNFNQVTFLDIDCTIPRAYIRSVVAYDQFTTIAQFEALWLSDEVRSSYTELYSRTNGKNEAQKKALLQRQLDESKHFIMFLVLTPYEMPLGEQKSIWNVFLAIDDTSFFAPIEIKQVEILPVYRAYFGEKAMRFKSVYQIKFDARDVNDNALITSSTQQLVLYFRSIKQEVKIVWNISDLEKQEEKSEYVPEFTIRATPL
jgi:hypothetical protein